jgi:3-phosphoshikimate 1-carboxyvinyltransferase
LALARKIPMQYPRQIEIEPLAKLPCTSMRVPGSKSITNRALVLAALTVSPEQRTVLDGALYSEDTEVMIHSLRRLGISIAQSPEAYVQWVRFSGDADAEWPVALCVAKAAANQLVPAANAELFVANSGTSMRFLTAMVALGHGRYRLDGVPRMRERPIGDLLDALNHLGVKAVSEFGNGFPPIVIDANGLPGGTVHIKGGTSSQFLSSLLMVAPFAQSDLSIEVEGTLVSAPYVTMTVAMMRQFGLTISQDRPDRFRVPAPQKPQPLERYAIEPDASAASYFFGAAAITGGSITVSGLPMPGLQGDVHFVDMLERMGCSVECAESALTVHGGRLRGIDVDMNDISDTVMTLGVVACFAEGPTTIRNVAHIRHKETDRLSALAAELRRIGADVVERADGLTITPAPLHGATIATYNDHRMAMSLALVGLKIPGIVIDDPACVAKTYPRFFEDLERLR